MRQYRRGWSPLEKNPLPNYARVDQALQRENRKWPKQLTLMAEKDWPEALKRHDGKAKVISVWRSCDFAVLVYDDQGHTRMSVNRASIDIFGEYRDGITWDDLQRLKAEAGFADRWMVEIYPPAGDVVNVHNLRHLWLLPEPPPYGWKKGDRR